MKFLILLAPILLTGCLFKQPVPIKQIWPDVPKELLEACPDLKLIRPETDKLSDVISTVSDNYSSYYECKAKVDDWILWYNGQKKISESK